MAWKTRPPRNGPRLPSKLTRTRLRPWALAHLTAVALRTTQLLVWKAVQVRVLTTEEPVAGPADGTLRVGDE